ncbi:uncharacterized protein [Haliotis asinina]|uniref:uncharacterized protein n=1 Tax=Haliotis asinina TaxID=109174 RepID=UPI003531E244
MCSLEHSDTPSAWNNRPFLYPSPSWPESGIGLLLRASEIVNQPQSIPQSGVDILLQAADLTESESKLVFDKPESGINLLTEVSEPTESCTPVSNSEAPASSFQNNSATASVPVDALSLVDTAIAWLENHIASIGQETHTKTAKKDHTYAHPTTPITHEDGLSTGRSLCQPVDCADSVDTAILWLEREIANSTKDSGKHLFSDKTASPSTDCSSFATSVTSSSRPGTSHRRKINGSKITKVTAASGCTCLGQQKKTLRKITKSQIQKRRSDDEDYMWVCCAKKTKNNKTSKVNDIITSTHFKKRKGNTLARAYAKTPTHVSPKANANWTSGQTPPNKDTSTLKQVTSVRDAPCHLLTGRSSAITQKFSTSRKRPVQVVMPIRSVNQTLVLSTPAKRPCPKSPWFGGSPVLDCHHTETKPLTRHPNRVRRRRLRHAHEPIGSSSRLITSGISYSHRPIGVVVPWIRPPTPHTNRSVVCQVHPLYAIELQMFTMIWKEDSEEHNL